VSRRSGSCCHPFALLPQLADQAREALGPDPHLECLLPYFNPLDEQLLDPSLIGGEQLAPDRGEVDGQVRDSRGNLLHWSSGTEPFFEFRPAADRLAASNCDSNGSALPDDHDEVPAPGHARVEQVAPEHGVMLRR
jgi:hypothetical protein